MTRTIPEDSPNRQWWRDSELDHFRMLQLGERTRCPRPFRVGTGIRTVMSRNRSRTPKTGESAVTERL